MATDQQTAVASRVYRSLRPTVSIIVSTHDYSPNFLRRGLTASAKLVRRFVMAARISYRFASSLCVVALPRPT